MITKDIIENAYDNIPFAPGTMKYCDPERGTACAMGAVYVADTGDIDIHNETGQDYLYGARLKNHMAEHYGVRNVATWGCGFDRAFNGDALYEGDKDTYPSVHRDRVEGYQMGLFVRDFVAGKTREPIKEMVMA